MIDPDLVSRFVARVEIALQDRHFDRAHRIVDECELAFTSPPDPITLCTSLAAVDLPMRVVGLLERRGLRTVGDVLRLRPDELAEIPSLGPESVRSIVSTIRELTTTIHDGDDDD